MTARDALEALGDDEKHELLRLLLEWRRQNSTTIAYKDGEDGEWIDVEPDWSQVEAWLT